MFYNNGIVIQETNKNRFEFTAHPQSGFNPNQNYLSYRGLARYYSWPLGFKHGLVANALLDEANDKWFGYNHPMSPLTYPIETAPDRDYCIRYVNHCQSKGIETRLLFCRTEIGFPIWDSPLPAMKFLGYDYSTSQAFFPIIPGDLLLDSSPDEKLGPEMYRLLEFDKKLNENQLFNTESDIRDYIKTREEAFLAENYMEHDDLVVFEVSEVIGEL
jgi:hypothetical protein